MTRLLAAALVACCIVLPDVAAQQEENITAMFYNLRNYRVNADDKVKPPESYAAVERIIAETAPDILVVAELMGDGALARLRTALKERGQDYVFQSRAVGGSPFRHLGILAKVQPSAILHDVYSTYELKGEHIPIRRGYLHCTFDFANGYTLHIVGAHLKSKVFHKLGQTDMRRYEARQLRYLVTELVKDNEDSNVLVMGDLNDSPNSSPILSVINNRFGHGKRLYDLRPLDSDGNSWTHMWDDADSYNRFDYAFASYGLVPEIDIAGLRLADPPDWYEASDHRAVIVPINLVNRPQIENLWDVFTRQSIRRTEPLVEGRIVGPRKPIRKE
jgi:endonuclease/exonuclease/phosphatase family metal-dependent hydrolase